MARPAYKFAINLESGDLFHLPGNDHVVEVADVMMGAVSTKVVDHLGRTHEFPDDYDNIVRMYYPALDAEATSA